MTTISTRKAQGQSDDLFRKHVVCLLATGLYAAAALYKSLHHIFWRDEWAVWLTGKTRQSIAEVVQAVHYDGNPPLWYIIQHGLSRVSGDPTISKYVHVAIASCSIFVILRYGPFSVLEKLLLPLGYFFFFEYSTITRTYAAEILLALIAAAAFTSARKRPIVYAIVLFLIGQWSLFGIILSLALAAGVAVQWRKEGPPRLWKAAAGILVASLALFYFTTRLAPDAAGFDIYLNDHLKIAESAARLFDAYVPLPKLGRHWWNTTMIALPDIVRGLLGAGMLWIASKSCRSREARVVLLTGSGLVFAALLVVYAGSMRHWGHYFIVLLLAVWIDRRSRGQNRPCWGDRAFVALLAIQAAAGLIASVLDLRQPFSASVQAAEVIRRAGADLPIAGDYDFCLSPLTGMLNRPVTFIRSGKCDWIVRIDKSRKRNVTIAMITRTIHVLAAQAHSDAILVMTYPVALPKEMEEIAHIPPGTVADESYYIYRYRWRGDDGE